LSLYEGEFPVASENHSLGQFQLEIDTKTQTAKSVQLNFTMDLNGLLKITSNQSGKKRFSN